MTRRCLNPEAESPFGQWLRAQRSIDSVRWGLVVSNVDWLLHKYKKNVDGLGERDVHLLAFLETKAFGDMPTKEERQTLFFYHQLLRWKDDLACAKDGGVKRVWSFGCFVLSMPGLYPGDGSPWVTWCIFRENGQFTEYRISVPKLVRILGFVDSPETLKPLSLRRHHKDTRVLSRERMPLGIFVDRIVTRRS